MGGVDLHIHTTASDGLLTPAEVVRVALEKGLSAIAITDHDTTDGLDEALAAARGHELEVIPGIELSAEQGSREVHILGYYVNHRDRDLQEKLEVLGRARRERARKMVGKLAGMGLPVSWERVLEIAGDSSAFGRPHVAQALQEKGYVGSINEAFYKFIGLGGPAYVARYKLTPTQALEMIRAAGGLPVLAHPWRQEDVAIRLAGCGLVGLEAYYPRYSHEEREELAKLGQRYGLIATGGTDFHGYEQNGPLSLGDVRVPADSVERLRALGKSRMGRTDSFDGPHH
ncbi:MAG TPA: PHP domain-containing protein [Anaerolineae bacterium]|nr:PHP domain-containing protein [Anaerolineae bacterium]